MRDAPSVPSDSVVLVDRYLRYLEAEGRSSATLEGYCIDIRAMLVWFTKVGVSPLKAREVDITNYIKSRESDGAKPATIARSVSAMISFFNFLVISGDIAGSPMASLRKPQVKRVPKPFIPLTAEELTAIFTGPDPSKRFGKRNQLLLKFLITTKMKASELVELKLSDIDLSTGKCLIRGRRGNGCEIMLGESLREQIRDYIEKYREDVCFKVDSEYLFPSRNGGHLSRTSLWYKVKMSAVRSGVHKKIDVRILRRSYRATTEPQT